MALHRLLGAILLMAGSPPIAAAQTASQDPNYTKTAELQTSDWGPEVNGVQLRATLPKRLEQGKRIEVAAEFRSDAAMLPPGVRALNPCHDMCSYFHLHLTNLDGGFLTILDASTRVFGPSPMDDGGRWATPFDPERNIQSKAHFTSLVEATPIACGRYRAQLVYDQPSTPNPGWRTSSEDWNSRGFWSGKVASQSVEIEILRESSRTETIFVPKRLHPVKFDLGGPSPYRGGPLRADSHLVVALTYSMEDAEAVVVPRRNGHWIMQNITSTGEDGSLRITGGPPTPDDHDWVDNLSASYWTDGLDYDLAVSIFESCEPNLRHSGPGCAGYKLLWERTFHVHYTAEELADLPIRYAMTP